MFGDVYLRGLAAGAIVMGGREGKGGWEGMWAYETISIVAVVYEGRDGDCVAF